MGESVVVAGERGEFKCWLKWKWVRTPKGPGFESYQGHILFHCSWGGGNFSGGVGDFMRERALGLGR